MKGYNLHLCEHDSTVWVQFVSIGDFDVVVDLCVEFLYHGIVNRASFINGQLD